ncbi:hypothetical protein CR970_02480 [Candidatus Saccharibacteria bacterium]|nr:MAG: hypothetical protein CR970_02480 [Candidatus Saccharibacteria bacterium]
MIVLAALLFFLPAGIANMLPVLAAKAPLLRHWNTPIDFNAKLGGKPIFGSHKTWRGLLIGVIGGAIVGSLLPSGIITDYYPGWSAAAAASMSFGALAGDAIKSFFKRRSGRPSGATWFPFDQLDYIVGGLLCSLPFGVPSLSLVATVFGLYFCLHVASTHIGYWLKLKSSPL